MQYLSYISCGRFFRSSSSKESDDFGIDIFIEKSISPFPILIFIKSLSDGLRSHILLALFTATEKHSFMSGSARLSAESCSARFSSISSIALSKCPVYFSNLKPSFSSNFFVCFLLFLTDIATPTTAVPTENKYIIPPVAAPKKPIITAIGSETISG